MNLSKSKYTNGVVCDKRLWLDCYKKEEKEEQNLDSVFANGNLVGDLARHLFGDDYILIEYDPNYNKMISETKKYLDKKPNIICEASFDYDNNICLVDILKNDEDGVEIYEVKSSTKINEIYIDDVSYQTWVLKKLGYNVKKSFIVYVNNQYVKNGEFDLKKYFVIKDVTGMIDLNKVEENVKRLHKVLELKDDPLTDLSINCTKPYGSLCPFFKYCTKNLPQPNVFDLGWKYTFKKKIELYNDGLVEYKDLFLCDRLTTKVYNQIDHYIHDLSPRIDKKVIKEFLDKLKFPLYFFDFESYQAVVPEIDGTKPYQQICFQYSLHYYLEENGELLHKEYLSKDYNGNPMYKMCKQLCEDIPLDSCVLVYNQTFEKARLREMAELFPEFSDHLLNIRENIIDLMVPFFNHDYYTKDMKDSYSIKVVLPALFPNDPELDYHNLDQVHKGDEASEAYLSLKDLPKDEEEKLRYNMLKYCELDTYAMVKIYQKLKEVTKDMS